MHKIISKFIFLIVICLFCSQSKLIAQTPIYFQHLTTNNGLSQNDVNSIYQDNQGFMWIATHDGLNKYDGYGFKVYNPDSKNSKSINSNLIYALTADNNGDLWLGTTGNGLNYFNKTLETFTHFTHEEGNSKSLSSNHITALYLDKNNMLWIGTNDGINLLDLNKPLDDVSFKHFNINQEKLVFNKDKNTIFSIFEDSKNQLWIGGTDGLYKLSRDNNGEVYFKLINEKIGLPNLSIRSINEDTYGRLIIGSNKGLFLLDGNEESHKTNKVCDGFFNVIAILDNHIWAGTNNGLLYFNSTNKNKLPELKDRYVYNPRNPNSISKNIVKSLFVDHTGIVWVGTNGGGVNKFDPDRKHFRHIRKTLDPKSLSYDKIRAMFEDSNGTLWIGTEGGGLNMILKENIDENYNHFKTFESILKPFALAEIKKGNDKKIFIGAESTPGLFILDISDPNNINEKNIKEEKDITHSVFSILEDSHKNVWIGTYNGGLHRWLYQGDDTPYKKEVFFHSNKDSSSISSNIIRNIYEDSKKNIWFATADGLSLLPQKEISLSKPKFQSFKHQSENKESISHNYILELYESKDSVMWIGTFGGGLNKYIPSTNGKLGHFITYDDHNGLPNNIIKGILEDDHHNLWLSTNKGLSKFNPKQETFKNYDVNDGLQNNEFQELARLKRKNGEMLFGGINGFNVFYPEDIIDNSYEAETVITELSITNKPVKIGDEINGRILLNKAINDIQEIELKYSENSFSFEFAALHYAAPLKNKFAYMLEGFDKDWIYTTSKKRFATYTNIAPGTYTLKVKASNNDGIWDSTPKELKIEVIPPFYLTKIAYVVYLLLFVLVLLLYRRFTIIKTTKKHQLELNHLENEKNEELQRIKLEFFTNISHEFRTPLTLIKGPIEFLQKNGENLNQKELQEQYALMQKNSSYLMRLVNQLLDFRKINQGKMSLVVRKSNIVTFIKEVAEPFQFLSHKQVIDFQVKASNQNIISWFDHTALEKIINNLLSNAFKFTPEHGTVVVEISDGKEIDNTSVVIIKVIDSGEGISENRLQNIFERFYIEEDKHKNNPQGAGIGLAFTKSLVELHRGTIQAISNENEGTQFIVKLPMDKVTYLNVPEIVCKEETDGDFLMRSSEKESFAIDINDELLDDNITKSRSKLPILLIVDDNADIRSFIKQVLGKEYEIYEAENGEEGFNVASKVIPNIIITDLLMPIMDGLQFCEKLKTTKTTSHIPVIMLTAKISQESELKGLKNGADDYIRKPFDTELLKIKLKNIIKNRDILRKRFNREINLQPKEVTVTSTDELFLQQAIDIVEKHMMNTDFSVEMLVKEMGHSRSNLYLKFKEITGLSSSEFIRNIRLKRAVQLFEQSDLSVKEIMYMTGFNTASYFAKCFKKQFGVIPSEYVRQSDRKDQTE
ncbi:hybrid sensor histidine kinase/response regulator transcription factor [Wenyingzhuangia fucanilytica]|uniref:hybrid sensor histidine kinase/response regulator transcription factor n=1 Tax=Wenyingzhuangia fucanilytica TaxID=1790137 RepID=UPI00083B7DD4|nr:hybrid sensor histidine kinase/response regulator transcription factor [Wenyingzhuangia fucanilytica]